MSVNSEQEKDQYYERTCNETLGRVAEETKGKPHAETIKAWKQAYPFGTDRKGRKYKIWNRLFNEWRECLRNDQIIYD
ncbi:MAG TPA: hypothetical protein V6C76_11880 [Drouetiella sp.]